MKKILLLGIAAMVFLLSLQGCYVGFAPGWEGYGGHGWYEQGHGQEHGHGYGHGHRNQGWDSSRHHR